MIELPLGCSCTELKIHPHNWQTNKSAIKKLWYIYYRFHDPAYMDNPKYKKGKLVIVKGMNHFKTQEERISLSKHLINQELEKLKNGAYNPIKGRLRSNVPSPSEMEPSTPFITALIAAERRIKASESTKRDLKSIIKSVAAASNDLGYSRISVSMISRKHIKQILLKIDENMGESTHRYNKIRSYLMIIYAELLEMETVETNPLCGISKKKTIIRLRKLPTPDNRTIINDYLREHHFRFWIFMQIFFHSGARLTEMMMVRKEHINLEKQSFIITIKKGSNYREVERPIKNIALQYWMQAIEGADKGDFVFSTGLAPGKVPIKSYQITKRWNRHIKKKLGIDDDFYSLKHLNLDETAALLGLNDAAAMASHSSTEVTARHYAVNELHRQSERLKSVDNPFDK